MPRQERQRRGREGTKDGGRDQRKICRRWGGWRVVLGKKNVRGARTLTFSVIRLLPLFLSCTFLSIQRCMRGASQSVCGEEGGGFRGPTPSLNPVDSGCKKKKKKKAFADDYFWFPLGS